MSKKTKSIDGIAAVTFGAISVVLYVMVNVMQFSH